MMASPLRQRFKWPSEARTNNNGGTDISDFAPYVSNLTNMLRRVPRPIAPRLTNPITGTRVSLADAKRQVDETSRAADLSTQGLDAQTGAAIRVGNTANRLRSLSDLNAKESYINAQFANQNSMVNANIESQNNALINQYHDDQVGAQMAQQRVDSENISNAADKFMGQRTAQDMMNLDKEKAMILSKMYTPGVYDRFMKSLSGSGIDVNNLGYTPTYQPQPYQRTQLPDADPSVYNPTVDRNMMVNMKKYFDKKRTYAAGGLINVFGHGETGDPTPKPTSATPLEMAKKSMNSTNRNALFADMFNNVVANDIDPYKSEQGASAMSQARYFFNPQFAADLGARINILRADPAYKTMSPKERVARYYSMSRGDNELGRFLNETSSYGGSPTAFFDSTPYKAAGGSIHIKPQNRGKFTAYKKRTGQTTEEALHSKNPHVRQMANFARNAAKWHHANGGELGGGSGDPTYDFTGFHGVPNAADSAAYRQFYNMMAAKDPRAANIYDWMTGNTGGWGTDPFAGMTLDPRYRPGLSPMNRYNQAITRENAVKNARADMGTGATQNFYGMKLYKPRDTPIKRRSYGGGMIKPFC